MTVRRGPPDLQRRHALALAAALPLAAAACRPRDPDAVQRWLHAPDAPPFDIPADYLGLHTNHGVATATGSPLAHGAVRSHDAYDAQGMPRLHWAMIETAPGTYDWTAVEAWLQAHAGKTRIFVLFGCPRFYQKYPDEPWRYPYLPGGGSPPADPADAGRFIAALLARFPDAFDYVELWNEPNFGWHGSDARRTRWDPGRDQPGFFTGTAADLAAMARTVRAAMAGKTRLMGGAWEGQHANDSQINSMLRFSSAPDGAGGTGARHLQALSVHCYVYEHDPNAIVDVLAGYQARFRQAGHAPDLPRVVSEAGFEAPGVWTADEPPLALKRARLMRLAMIPAAMGYHGVYLYKDDAMRTLGAPARTPELAEALATLQARLPGQRLVSAALMGDDTLAMTFADGGTLRA